MAATSGGTTIGVLGGGQLGRMLALAGTPLGLRFRFFDTSENSPASHIAECIVGPYDDFDALQRFVRGLDLVTFEFENVPVVTADFVQQNLPIYPGPKALKIAQDRLSEKQFFRELNIPTARFTAAASVEDVRSAVAQIGMPCVLKTRRLGYDGKGQRILRSEADIEPAWQALAGTRLILEEYVPFEREVSILAVRSRSGAFACYPLIENVHEAGILRVSRSPSEFVTPELQRRAEEYAKQATHALDYVGVLAVEFFVRDGQLIANEMAPRVHNSGHLTIEGSSTSQFENHLRAILGLPLGATSPTGYAAMVNIIGSLPDTHAILQITDAHLHLYGKEPRPGRKLGHVTLLSDTLRLLDKRVEALRNALHPS